MVSFFVAQRGEGSDDCPNTWSGNFGGGDSTGVRKWG